MTLNSTDIQHVFRNAPKHDEFKSSNALKLQNLRWICSNVQQEKMDHFCCVHVVSCIYISLVTDFAGVKKRREKNTKHINHNNNNNNNHNNNHKHKHKHKQQPPTTKQHLRVLHWWSLPFSRFIAKKNIQNDGDDPSRSRPPGIAQLEESGPACTDDLFWRLTTPSLGWEDPPVFCFEKNIESQKKSSRTSKAEFVLACPLEV